MLIFQHILWFCKEYQFSRKSLWWKRLKLRLGQFESIIEAQKWLFFVTSKYLDKNELTNLVPENFELAQCNKPESVWGAFCENYVEMKSLEQNASTRWQYGLFFRLENLLKPRQTIGVVKIQSARRWQCNNNSTSRSHISVALPKKSRLERFSDVFGNKMTSMWSLTTIWVSKCVSTSRRIVWEQFQVQ